MASEYLIQNRDLSLGAYEVPTQVTDPTDWRIVANIKGAPVGQKVKVHLWIEAPAGVSAPLTDGSEDYPIIKTIQSGAGDTAGTIAAFGVSAPIGKVWIYPPKDKKGNDIGVGTIDIYSINP